MKASKFQPNYVFLAPPSMQVLDELSGSAINWRFEETTGKVNVAFEVALMRHGEREPDHGRSVGQLGHIC